MPQINHSEDLKRLRDEGVEYSLVKGTILIVKDIPYLNNEVQLKYGTLIVTLSTTGDTLLPPADHTAFWCGEQPCNTDGSVISGLINGPSHRDFGSGIFSNYFLSRKPIENGGKYLSYYDKVMQHINMISTPTKEQYPIECKRTKDTTVLQDEELPFVYGDTNASRANITGVCECMENQKLAIIGLGGTGMYLLDLLAKCPVAEIHLFDDDIFNNHNSFRAPGAADIDILNRQPTKVSYAAEVYCHIKRNIIPHEYKINPENISELDNMDFIFICVDSANVRNMIAKYLAEAGKSFIDSGLGLELNNGHIVGQVRVTAAITGHFDHLRDALSSMSGDEDDPYASNIQIAELNSMAALLAVVKWKKLLGFYADTSSLNDFNAVYCVDSNSIIKNCIHED